MDKERRGHDGVEFVDERFDGWAPRSRRELSRRGMGEERWESGRGRRRREEDFKFGRVSGLAAKAR